jgi:hypothetical protein
MSEIYKKSRPRGEAPYRMYCRPSHQNGWFIDLGVKRYQDTDLMRRVFIGKRRRKRA